MQENTKTENKYKAQDKYDKANTIKKTFKFNKKTDADILAFLAASGNMQGTVKKALRAMISEQES